MSGKLQAPFPYFGGKSRISNMVWERFGKVDVYVEPFAGSLAVLLGNPHPAKKEVVCDTDSMICNFWRAITNDPEQVAHFADYPTIHQDLTSRHKWLKQWKLENQYKVMEDPHYYDPKVAGWWVWGISSWIGGGWCSVEKEQVPNVQITGGKGVQVQRDQRPKVHEKGGQGVQVQRKDLKLQDQIPLVRDTGGRGVSAQRKMDKRPNIDARLGGQGVQVQRGARLVEWFGELAVRLNEVFVLNRDWKSAVTPTILSDTPSCADYTHAIFLDPPYLTSDRDDTLYQSDASGTSDDTARECFEWAVKHGEKYKIVYCGHDEDFDVPPGWDKHVQSFGGVYKRDKNKKQDMIMFSPACNPESKQADIFG